MARGSRPCTACRASAICVLTCSHAAVAQLLVRHGARPRREHRRRAAHGKLAEGYYTAPVLLEMAQAKGVEMPISTAVAAILAGKLGVDAAIEGLLTRPLKAEE